MKSSLLFAVLCILMIASCSKNNSNNTGIAAAWVGNYDVAGTNDTINRVGVTQVNSNTVNMAIEISSNGGASFYTPVTITNVAVLTDSTAGYNSYDLVNSSPSAFHIVGTAQRSGNILTLIANVTDTLTNSTLPYQFSGKR